MRLDGAMAGWGTEGAGVWSAASISKPVLLSGDCAGGVGDGLRGPASVAAGRMLAMVHYRPVLRDVFGTLAVLWVRP